MHTSAPKHTGKEKEGERFSLWGGNRCQMSETQKTGSTKLRYITQPWKVHNLLAVER